MILQIVYNKELGARQNEQYIGEVEEVRFYDDSLTFKKNRGEVDNGFIREINYATEKDIQEIYLLNDNGKTVKAVRDIFQNKKTEKDYYKYYKNVGK